jgi:hypothetical protein
MSYEARREIVLTFIGNNPMCSAQNVVDGVEDKLSRTPVFEMLKELIKEGSVIDEKINRRDHRFVINKNNPLVSIRKDLEEFEKAYFPLLHTAQKRLHDWPNFEIPMEQSSQISDSADKKPSDALDPVIGKALHALELVSRMLHIFYEVSKICMLRTVMGWSKTIQDRDQLKKLHSLVITKLLDMQLRIYDMFNTKTDAHIITSSLSREILNATFDLEKVIKSNFRYYKIENDVEPLLNSVTRISKFDYDFTPDKIKELTGFIDKYPDAAIDIMNDAMHDTS